MYLLYNFFLFCVSFAGGCIPLLARAPDGRQTPYLLAFSGSFLLGITFLHLLPETFEVLHHRAGILLLAGFFIQMFIQRITHGFEHGHVHVHGGTSVIPLNAIFIGMAVHAFMEGIPLGFGYLSAATEPSLYLAIAAHKLPEAMLITSVAAGIKGKKKAVMMLFFFSLITPAASVLAGQMGKSIQAMASLVTWLIPVVAGAFIHIATTIFYESGTRQHLMTTGKAVAVLAGMGAALLTLLFE